MTLEKAKKLAQEQANELGVVMVVVKDDLSEDEGATSVVLKSTATHSIRINTRISGKSLGDLVQLELSDLVLSERAGSATFKYAKGGKELTVPLPLSARRAIQAWINVRPPTLSSRVFLGCRGALTETGVRKLCDK
jgi:integrase/recombinase XerC